MLSLVSPYRTYIKHLCLSQEDMSELFGTMARVWVGFKKNVGCLDLWAMTNERLAVCLILGYTAVEHT